MTACTALRDSTYDYLSRMASAAGQAAGSGSPLLRLDCSKQGIKGLTDNGRIRLQEPWPDIVWKDAPEKPFTLYIEAEKLAKVVKPLSKKSTLRLQISSEYLQIRGSNSRSKLQAIGIPPVFLDDRVYEPENETLVRFPGEAFAEQLQRIRCAVAKNDTFPILTGVYLEIGKSQYRLTATDGKRLAHLQAPLLEEIRGPKLQVVIPAVNLSLIQTAARLHPDAEWSVTPQKLICRTPAFYLESTLLDGQYLAYRRVLPETAEHHLQVSAAEWLAALQQVAPLTDTESPVLRLETKNDCLLIQSRPSATGIQEEAVSELPVTWLSGEGDCLTLMNRDFLLDAAKILTGETWQIRLNGPKEAMEITDGFTRYIVMAMRQ